MFVTIIIFILILGVLIFAHELGHFILARRNGIKAEEFGFGFPPRALGIYKETLEGKWKFIWGGKEIQTPGTIYSVNFLPLGGFVRMKGENGEEKNDPDSFAAKSPWARIKVLAGGVIMNLILAWFLISLVFMIGAPTLVNNQSDGTSGRIRISEIAKDSPAEAVGLRSGDEILKKQIIPSGDEIILKDISDVQNVIEANRGKEMDFRIMREGKEMTFKVTPRIEAPQGQGPMGIAFAEEVDIVKYPFFQAVWLGFLKVFELIGMMFSGLWLVIKNILTTGQAKMDVVGPVGIAVLTKQVASLGLVYVLQFAALLSINLAIINALPIPALDGGRILFIFIEKIKRSPVSQKTEQIVHTVGFVILIALMILVTFRDIEKLIK